MKKKLTLSVDEEVIEAARSSGLNISEFTELILKSVAQGSKAATPRDLIKDREPLFAVIRPILAKLQTSLVVGRFYNTRENDATIIISSGPTSVGSIDDELTSDLRLHPDGLLEFDGLPIPSEYLDRVELLPPLEIVRNLMQEIQHVVQLRERDEKDMDFATRFVELIAEKAVDMASRSSIRSPGKRGGGSQRSRGAPKQRARRTSGSPGTRRSGNYKKRLG